MSQEFIGPNRRLFLGALAVGFFTTRGLLAEHLAASPRMTEGPFYPDKLPLDQDNDLIVISDSITPAVGEITNLVGTVKDSDGNPLKDLVVEIWQCDANGVYLHSKDSGRRPEKQDKNFQGFGRFTTAKSGEYRFRTIKPVAYPGRPSPHIHVKVKQGDRELLTTQCFIRGNPGNSRDQIFKELNKEERELVQIDFVPVPDSKIGELTAKFDIVLGLTPAEKANKG